MIKKLHFKVLLLMATLVFGVGNVWGDDVIYSETFGNPSSNTNLSDFTGFSSDLITPTSDAWKVGTGSACGLTGSSGSGNAYVGSGSKDILFNFGNKLSNYTNVKISFNYYKGSGKGKANNLVMYFSGNGGTTYGSDLVPANSNASAWYALTDIAIDDNLLDNFCIKFSNVTDNNNIARIDDIVITGTLKSTSPLASIALTGSYPTTFYKGGVFSHEGMVVTATYEDTSTKDVTAKATFTGYNMSSLGSQTVTVSYTENEVTKTASYGITVIAIPTHTAYFSVNGEVVSSSVVEEGADIVFPAEDPADLGGKKFVGWAAETISGTTDEEPTFVSSAVMGNADVTYYAVFATLTSGGVVTVVDNLTRSTTGVTGTGYSSWSNKTATSDAVYAGQSAGGNSSIQLRSDNSNSGIVTTTSGGKVKKVVLTWNSNTAAGRTVNVYGSNTAYTNATDLYDDKKQGTLLGTIVYGTSTELDITGDYTYVGLRSNSGALYLTKVAITWETVGPDTYSAYCTTVPNTVPLTITDAGFATYCSAYDLDFSGVAGLTAYKAVMNGTTVQFTKVNKVPAGKGVLVQGAAKTYDVPVVASSGTDVSGNVLVGTYTGTTIDGTNASTDFFVLKKNTAGVGFYRVTNAAYQVRANTAYLAVDKNVSAKGFIPVDGTTAIDLVDTANEVAAPAYNLQGQRVSNGYKGVVIVNGKKYMK